MYTKGSLNPNGPQAFQTAGQIIDQYAKKINTLCKWQRSHNRQYVLIGPKDSNLWNHPELSKAIRYTESVPGYSSRVRTNCQSMEEALYYNVKGNNKVSTHKAIMRGIHLYMQKTNRVQKSEALYSVEFEEITETSINFDIDIQNRTYTEEFWDASGKPLDYDGVILARQEELKEVRRYNLYTKVPIKSVVILAQVRVRGVARGAFRA